MFNTFKNSKAMKRLFTYGLMLASAFALTNCTEQLATPEMEENIVDEIAENNPPQEEGDRIPFEVYVNTVETKTITQDNKTFWVDEYTAKTYGLTQDAIYLYSYPASEADASKQKFTNHLEFRYNANGRFLGSVVEDALSSANNWYCIYPYNEVSMSTGSTIKETLTIGAKKSDGYIQVQSGLATMSHIAGENYPMYGILNNVAITKSPKFSMNHLFALVELEIQNLGDKIANEKETAVVIESIEFTAPEAIVGDFDVTISGSQPTYESTSNVSSKAIVNFTGSTVSIPTGNSAKVYFAVKPFDASGKSITLKINGAEKTITMPGNAKFEAGKKTTLKVPIEFGLGTPITNMATLKGHKVGGTGFKSEKEVDMITFDQYSKSQININGELVDVYTVGKYDGETKKYTPGKVILEGKPSEFIRLIPMQFYAASGPSGKSVMRLGSITLNVFGGIGGLVGTTKTLTITYKQLVEDIGLDPSNIVFDGLVPIQLQNNESIILYEDPVHKQVAREHVSNLVIRFDDDDYDDIAPTYDALEELFTTEWHQLYGWDNLSTEAQTTARILYNKLFPIVTNYFKDSSYSGIVEWLFGSTKNFMSLLRNDASMRVELETVPTDDEAGINDTRVLVWGLNSAKISN